jgi:hypothetical protein
VATPRCMFLVNLFWRWDVVFLTYFHIMKLYSPGCIDNNKQMKLYYHGCIDNNRQMKLFSLVLQAGVSLGEVTHSSSFFIHPGNTASFVCYCVYTQENTASFVCYCPYIQGNAISFVCKQMKLYYHGCIDNNRQMKLFSLGA